MMQDKMVKEISKHPILYVFVAIISSAMATWMTSFFATMAYVDKEVQNMTRYVDKRDGSIREEIKEIKGSVTRTENRVYQIWLHMKPKTK